MGTLANAFAPRLRASPPGGTARGPFEILLLLGGRGAKESRCQPLRLHHVGQTFYAWTEYPRARPSCWSEIWGLLLHRAGKRCCVAPWRAQSLLDCGHLPQVEQ